MPESKALADIQRNLANLQVKAQEQQQIASAKQNALLEQGVNNAVTKGIQDFQAEQQQAAEQQQQADGQAAAARKPPPPPKPIKLPFQNIERAGEPNAGGALTPQAIQSAVQGGAAVQSAGGAAPQGGGTTRTSLDTRLGQAGDAAAAAGPQTLEQVPDAPGPVQGFLEQVFLGNTRRTQSQIRNLRSQEIEANRLNIIAQRGNAKRAIELHDATIRSMNSENFARDSKTFFDPETGLYAGSNRSSVAAALPAIERGDLSTAVDIAEREGAPGEAQAHIDTNRELLQRDMAVKERQVAAREAESRNAINTARDPLLRRKTELQNRKLENELRRDTGALVNADANEADYQALLATNYHVGAVGAQDKYPDRRTESIDELSNGIKAPGAVDQLTLPALEGSAFAGLFQESITGQTIALTPAQQKGRFQTLADGDLKFGRKLTVGIPVENPTGNQSPFQPASIGVGEFTELMAPAVTAVGNFATSGDITALDAAMKPLGPRLAQLGIADPTSLLPGTDERALFERELPGRPDETGRRHLLRTVDMIFEQQNQGQNIQATNAALAEPL